MKKNITVNITVMIAILTFTVVTGAFAQDRPDTTKYKFDDDVVKGDLLRPDGGGILALKKDKTQSLVKVRKHYVPEMLKSVENI